MNKLRSTYNKRVKLFLGYSRCYSVTQMFLELGLPSFNTAANTRTYYISIPSPPHSLIPGLKPPFSANPSYRSLPFLLHD